MRKTTLMMSVSADGFFEGPDHELDWHLVNDELPGQLAGVFALAPGSTRPTSGTTMYLTGLRDDYRHDGRIITQILAARQGPIRAPITRYWPYG